MEHLTEFELIEYLAEGELESKSKIHLESCEKCQKRLEHLKKERETFNAIFPKEAFVNRAWEIAMKREQEENLVKCLEEAWDCLLRTWRELKVVLEYGFIDLCCLTTKAVNKYYSKLIKVLKLPIQT